MKQPLHNKPPSTSLWRSLTWKKKKKKGRMHAQKISFDFHNSLMLVALLNQYIQLFSFIIYPFVKKFKFFYKYYFNAMM